MAGNESAGRLIVDRRDGWERAMTFSWCKVLLGLAALCLVAARPVGADATALTVVVKNIKNGSGEVRLAIWDKADGFTEPEKAVIRLVLPAVPGELKFRFDDLQPGRYALATFHDENDNDKLDKTLLGYPEEGLAFSNGAWIKLGPPSFDDAAFVLGSEPRVVTVSMRY